MEYSEFSLRDPAGFVFLRDNRYYRQVNRAYAQDYTALVRSGLCDELVGLEALLPHRNVSLELAAGADPLAVLEPEQLPFISYPYEWSFSQLRDAALLTLTVADRAVRHGFILRDASAMNVQFRGHRPVFIDILSLGRLQPGMGWRGYRQFCQHFLVPLAVMSLVDPRLGASLRVFPDGIPLGLGSRQLGARGWLRPGLLLHLYAHEWISRTARACEWDQRSFVTPTALLRLFEHLRMTIEGLPKPRAPRQRTWLRYYSAECPYTSAASRAKRQVVRNMLSRIAPSLVFDLGANVGGYSDLAPSGSLTIAIERDCWASDAHYCRLRNGPRNDVLPLTMDLLNPSSSEGWAHRERRSLVERGPADAVLALALLHHLLVAASLPLPAVADLLASLGRATVVEFVPPDDPKAASLIARKGGLSRRYDRATFEAAFERRFALADKQALPETLRVLYLYRRKGD